MAARYDDRYDDRDRAWNDRNELYDRTESSRGDQRGGEWDRNRFMRYDGSRRDEPWGSDEQRGGWSNPGGGWHNSGSEMSREYDRRREGRAADDRRQWDGPRDEYRGNESMQWGGRSSDDRRWTPSRGRWFDEQRRDWNEYGRPMPRHNESGYDPRQNPQQGDHHGHRHDGHHHDGHHHDHHHSDHHEDHRHHGGSEDQRNWGRNGNNDQYDQRNQRHETGRDQRGYQQGSHDQGSGRREEPRRSHGPTWRDFESWSDDTTGDARHPGLGYSRGDDYHDRFWSTGDRHRDNW